MENMMISIGKHITANLAAFGLAAAADLILIEKPKSTLPDGGKRLIMLPMRTLPDTTRGVPFGNLLEAGVRGERFLTLIEFECKTRAPDPTKDFYWNTARQFRDKVFSALAGPTRAGITIPRYDWTDPESPVRAGEVWFEVDPARSSPMEDPVEDPNDPANKSVFLTYSVHWWRPVA
ncbi:MAG: hypothetical protein WC369_06215 [Dehalococcoidales bacterium]|jgi:hypothetical protein